MKTLSDSSAASEKDKPVDSSANTGLGNEENADVGSSAGSEAVPALVRYLQQREFRARRPKRNRERLPKKTKKKSKAASSNAKKLGMMKRRRKRRRRRRKSKMPRAKPGNVRILKKALDAL